MIKVDGYSHQNLNSRTQGGTWVRRQTNQPISNPTQTIPRSHRQGRNASTLPTLWISIGFVGRSSQTQLQTNQWKSTTQGGWNPHHLLAPSRWHSHRLLIRTNLICLYKLFKNHFFFFFNYFLLILTWLASINSFSFNNLSFLPYSLLTASNNSSRVCWFCYVFCGLYSLVFILNWAILSKQ